jgi:[glutamine synthetase] adenylyltransferase / [glutamine synthetase]-adenylyl-L-tyrosine phosphorylase
MESSELVAETLGEHLFAYFLANKRRSGTSTPPTSRRSSSSATCRCCRASRWRPDDRASPCAAAGPAGLDPTRRSRARRGRAARRDDDSDDLGCSSALRGGRPAGRAALRGGRSPASHPSCSPRSARTTRLARRVVAVGGASRPLGDLLGRSRHPDAVDALRTLDGSTSTPPRPPSRRRGRQRRPGRAGRRHRRDPAAATADIAGRDLTGGRRRRGGRRRARRARRGVLTGTLRAVHQQVAGDDAGGADRGDRHGQARRRSSTTSPTSTSCSSTSRPTAPGDEEAAREAKAGPHHAARAAQRLDDDGPRLRGRPDAAPRGPLRPLSRTVASFVAYWERWAKTWEFQALLKARPVAGDLDLGASCCARRAVRVARAARPRGGRRDPRDEGPDRGQARGGPPRRAAAQARPGRHPRHRVRRPAAAARPRPRGPVAAAHRHAADARGAGGGGYVDEEDADRVRRRLPAAAHRRAPAPARPRTAHPHHPRRPGRQEWLARSLGYRPRPTTGPRAVPARADPGPGPRSASCTPSCSTGRCSRPTRPCRRGRRRQRARRGHAMGEDAAVERLRRARVPGRRRGAARRPGADRWGVRRARTVRAVLPAVLQVLQDTPDPDTGLPRSASWSRRRATRRAAGLPARPPAAPSCSVGCSAPAEVAGELLVGQPQGVDWLRDEHLRDEPRTRDELVRLASAGCTGRTRPPRCVASSGWSCCGSCCATCPVATVGGSGRS